ncbi:hypothetical protein D3C72_1213040 [compost metagenome]
MVRRGRRLRHYLAGLRQRLFLQLVCRCLATRLRRLARGGVAGVLAGGMPVLWIRCIQRSVGRPIRIKSVGADGNATAGLGTAACRRRTEHDADLPGLWAGRGPGCGMFVCAGGGRGAALVSAAARAGVGAGGQRHRGGHAADAATGCGADRAVGMAKRLSCVGRGRSGAGCRRIALGGKLAAGPGPDARWRATGPDVSKHASARRPVGTGRRPQQAFRQAIRRLPGLRVWRLCAVRAFGALRNGPRCKARTGRAAA